PLPYGLPLRSVAYGLVAFVAVLALARLPVVGAPMVALPVPVRLAVLPALIAYLLTQLRPDGRPAHWFLLAWARHHLGARRVVALAPSRDVGGQRLERFVVAPDERESRYRAGTVAGPAVALLRQPVRERARRKTLVLEAAGD